MHPDHARVIARRAPAACTGTARSRPADGTRLGYVPSETPRARVQTLRPRGSASGPPPSSERRADAQLAFDGASPDRPERRMLLGPAL